MSGKCPILCFDRILIPIAILYRIFNAFEDRGSNYRNGHRSSANKIESYIVNEPGKIESSLET